MALSLQTTLTQKPTLTPEQIQVVKMIEIPNAELEQRINEELQENPMLEIGQDETPIEQQMEDTDYTLDDDCSDIFGNNTDDSEDLLNDDYGELRRDESGDPLRNEDFDYDLYTQDDELPDYRYQTNNYSPDDQPDERQLAKGKDFRESLREQVGMKRLTEMQQALAEYIIDTLDDRGYLTRSKEQLADDLVFGAGVNVTEEEIEVVLQTVRQLDPPGIGAKDLQDCLLMQLKSKRQTESVELATIFITKHFAEISNRHYERLQQRYNLTDEQIKAALGEIQILNPTPSSEFSDDIYENHKAQVIPDFRVETYDDQIIVSLCDQNIPPLRVNHSYEEMLSSLQKTAGKKDKEGIRFIKSHIDSARWFIDALRQRNETMLLTMQAIVTYQREYFLEGDDAFLRPMILEDVARVTNLDPSTISRVSNSKYVQTDFGIIPLKHFFSESLTNDQGEMESTRVVKKILRELIDAEDKRHPLNDDSLVKLLAEDGHNVARRTIAKYRDQMGIPVARLRKQI